ncbi:MAG: GTPase Era [bacterium]|nr:GTPase Era [bacterium]
MVPPFRSGFVALIGRPNVGKSTLLNALLGQKISITADKPQTTRNMIRGVLSTEQFQAVLLDTPGIHLPKNELHKRIVGYAHKSITEADLIFFLTEPLKGRLEIGAGDRAILERLKGMEEKCFLLVNKIDQTKDVELIRTLELYNQLFDFAETFPISALKKKGLQRLSDQMVRRLPEGPAYFDPETVTDQPERVLCAELVREQVHRRLYQEVPFGVAVQIEKFQEEADMVRLWATIYVERDAHKKILIGKQGSMMKQIGTAARLRIETLLGSKVYLDLHVKVAKGWVNDPNRLAQFGYHPE